MSLPHLVDDVRTFSKLPLSPSLQALPRTQTNLASPLATMAAPQAYPPGGTFLDTLKKSFTDVPIDKGSDNAIATTEFLEAAESLTTLFGTSTSKGKERGGKDWANEKQTC